MRFKFLVAALLAAFLAAPLGAADRPVGPETGQAGNSADQVSSPGGPDDGGIDFGFEYCRLWWTECEVGFYDWRTWGRTGGGGRPGGPR